MTRVAARHDVAPLEYRVTWQEQSKISNAWMLASEVLLERIESILGPKIAAECAFELASGRVPRFIPAVKP